MSLESIVTTSSHVCSGTSPDALPSPSRRCLYTQQAGKAGRMLWMWSCWYNPGLCALSCEFLGSLKLPFFSGLTLFLTCGPVPRWSLGPVPQWRALFHGDKQGSISIHRTVDITLLRNSWFWVCRSAPPPHSALSPPDHWGLSDPECGMAGSSHAGVVAPAPSSSLSSLTQTTKVRAHLKATAISGTTVLLFLTCMYPDAYPFDSFFP